MADTEAPEFEHDELISEILSRCSEETARRSDAGESGAKTKEYLEKTRLNSKAWAVAVRLLKTLPKKDGQAKAMDIIRSLEALLPSIKDHVRGQGTIEMDLGEPVEAEGAAVSHDFNDGDRVVVAFGE